MISQMFQRAASIFFWIALALLLIGLLKENRGSAKLRSDGKVQFAPRWWFVCSWVFILVQSGFIGVEYARTGLKEPLQFASGILICITVIGGLASIPGPLVASDEFLEELRLFRRNKRIRWKEIEEISTEKRGTAVTVKSSDHRKIIYTNLYPDRRRFLLEIKQHCVNDLPANFPDE